MPSTRAARLSAWLTAQRNVTIFAAILIALPVAYAFHAAVGGGPGDFLLLMTLAVGVPTAYDDYWPRYDRTWQAVGWVVLACAVVTVEFTGLYLAGTALGLGPFPAAIGAFLPTSLGNLAWLARWR